MVGLVIISHSCKIAEGIRDVAAQMGPNVPIAVAGGTKDEGIGTDIDEILRAIAEVYSRDGVLVFFDLGSALMNAEMAVELLDEEQKERIKIMDSALVEGVIIGAVQSEMKKSLEEIMEELKPLALRKIS